jgi:hypothetical protein
VVGAADRLRLSCTVGSPVSVVDDVLQRIGANATALHECLREVVSAGDRGAQAVQAACAEADACRSEIEPGLSDLAAELAAARDSGAEAGRVQEVVNGLREADRRWPVSGGADPGAAATEVSELLVRVAELAGQMTLAKRVSSELLAMKPGQDLDLSQFLDGSVPTQAHQELVAWLAGRRNLVKHGVVDVTKGVAYRLPTSAGGRLWRYPIAQLVALAASVGVLAIAAEIAQEADDASLSEFRPWLHAYGAVLLGVLLHFGVAVMKRARPSTPGDGPDVSADVPVVSTWWQWLMLRPFAVAAVLVSPLVTVFVLRLLSFPVDLGSPKEMTTYVLAGYGADSIAALASQRLDDLSGVVTKNIAGKLG